MKKMKTIEIIVSPDGRLKLDAIGVEGADCERATAFLQEALGQVTASVRKGDFYARVHTKQQQRIGK